MYKQPATGEREPTDPHGTNVCETASNRFVMTTGCRLKMHSSKNAPRSGIEMRDLFRRHRPLVHGGVRVNRRDFIAGLAVSPAAAASAIEQQRPGGTPAPNRPVTVTLLGTGTPAPSLK